MIKALPSHRKVFHVRSSSIDGRKLGTAAQIVPHLYDCNDCNAPRHRAIVSGFTLSYEGLGVNRAGFEALVEELCNMNKDTASLQRLSPASQAFLTNLRQKNYF